MSLRSRQWLTGTLFALTVMSVSPMHGESAKSFYKKGQSAETRNDLETAFTDYSLALKKAPDDVRYKIAVERIRTTTAAQHVRRGEELEKQHQLVEALVEYYRALEVDSGNALAAQDVRRTKELLNNKDKGIATNREPYSGDLDTPGPPPHLDTPKSGPVSLEMTGLSSNLYQTIGKLSGVNVLIDPDFVSKTVTLDLKEVTPIEAFRILGELSNTFWKPVTHNTIYVAQDTRAKRKQLETQASRIFYLSNVSQQTDINDIQTTLRNMLLDTKLYAVPSQNAIVMRGTPDEIMLAKNLVAGLDRPKPEVLVDVYVMEVNRVKERNLGISPPTSLTVSSGSSATLNQIGETSSYSYSIGNAQAELMLSDSDTRILQNPSLRAVDGQKASLKIGLRIPYATGSYTTATSSTSSAVETQFQYIDTGVNVEMTPTIHGDHDITLKLSVEVSSETATVTISGVAEPEIAQQKAEQVIRLKDGEPSILAGLVDREIDRTVGGWPGLGEVPGVKYLFSTQDNKVTNEEIVFMLVPHIVRAPEINGDAAREIDTGSGDSIRIDRIPPLNSTSQTGATSKPESKP